MEDALKNAVAMIAGVWGGYVINGDSLENTDYHGNVFIADNPNPDAAQKVWRFNLGGMGYSTTGINGPFTSAWTADGHIVASLVTANMVQTGLLQSLNGESWLDLDNGAFSFGNGALKWSAADGFESLSAKKLTTPGSTAYATIGDIPYNDNGSQVMVPGLQLNGIWGNDAPFLSAFFGFGLHLLAGNGMDDLFLTAGAPSLLGGTILNQIGGDETTLKLMNGGPVFEVNGDTFGETRDVTVGTTIFHFQNGLFIGIN